MREKKVTKLLHLCLLTQKFPNFRFLPFKSRSIIHSPIQPTTLPTLHFIYYTPVLKILEFVFSSINLSIQVLGLGIFRALITAICDSKALFQELEILSSIISTGLKALAHLFPIFLRILIFLIFFCCPQYLRRLLPSS